MLQLIRALHVMTHALIVTQEHELAQPLHNRLSLQQRHEKAAVACLVGLVLG